MSTTTQQRVTAADYRAMPDLELDEVTVFRFEGGAVASERRIERGGRYETDLLPGFVAAIDDMIGPPELPA